MTSRRATEPGRKLHTAPIDGVMIEGPEMTNETTIARALDRLGSTVERAAKSKKTRSSVSPSTLAALRDDHVETRQTLAQRLERSRPAVNGPARELFSAREAMDLLRTRTTVTQSTGDPVLQWTKDGGVDLPGSGDRFAGLWRLRPAPNPAVGIGEETGTVDTSTAPTDWGVSVPEVGLAFTRTEIDEGARISASAHITVGAYEDIDVAFPDTIRAVLNRGVLARIDNELVQGDSTGSGAAKRLAGVANAGLTAQDATALGARWIAIATAAGGIRAANWTGPIATVLHPLDMVKLIIEKTATTNAPVWADATEALADLDADRFVLSTNVVQGTAFTGSWSEFGTVYVRDPISISVASSDQSDFINGMVRVVISTRVMNRIHHTNAAQKITNF